MTDVVFVCYYLCKWKSCKI